MTIDEMTTATKACLLEVKEQHRAVLEKLKATSDRESEDKAVDELCCWITAEKNFESALSALIQLGDLYKARQALIKKGGDWD